VTAGPQAAQSPLFQRTIAALGRRHVGAVAAIHDGADGEPLVGGIGRLRAAGGPAADADTTLEIGSITKTFTALALAQTVVAGRLSLDTPVRGLLPAGGAVPSRNGVDITVEHLARHTSPAALAATSKSAGHLDRRYAGRGSVRAVSTPVLLQELNRTRLRRTPGQPRIRYSNFGAGLLGLALTNVYDKATYHEMIEEVVLRPLGLVTTTSGGETQAAGHAFRRRPAPNWHLDGLAGAGALRSTARDLLSYLRAQLEPDRTPLAEAIRLTHVLLKPAARMTVGLGWMCSSSRAGRCSGTTAAPAAFAGSQAFCQTMVRPPWY
jgi:D-alanyl-D-alanine-carboxypeptidase/D-alanyl-D-alanine-endopeptidase